MIRHLLPALQRQRLAHLAILGGCLLALGMSDAKAAAALYQEAVEVRWGKVDLLRNGIPVSLETWYSERPLTFSSNAFFDERQRVCLSNAFQVCTGFVSQVQVWCFNSSSHGAFRERAFQDQCVTGPTFGIGAAPEPPDAGFTGSMPWTFRLRAEGAAAPQLTTLELTLLVEAVTPQVAWQVPLPGALADPAVRAIAQLSDAQEASVLALAEWASVYLVSPATLQENQFPTVVAVPNLRDLRVPIAFALRALAAIAPDFSRDRSITVANKEVLLRWLSPDRASAFPGASDWFPETTQSLDRLSLGALNTDRRLDALTEVLHRPGPNQSFRSPRVVESSDWVVRVGPFRRLEPAVARVTAMKGLIDTVPVDRLPKAFSNSNNLAEVQSDIRKIEAKMESKVAQYAPEPGEYFWLPEVARPHLETVRALESVRYIDSRAAAFDTNRFVYSATYAPVPITGKVGVSYNPEEGFGGQVAGGWTNWWSPGDAFRISGKIAERRIEGELSYQFRYYRSLDGKTQLHGELLGVSGTDEHYRLGGLSDQPFRHQYAQGGVEHRLHHDGGHWELSVADAILWESHELDQPDVAGPGIRSDEEGLVWNHRQSWAIRPNPGSDDARVWSYSIAPEMTLGPDVGWRDSFWVGQLAAGVRMDFGGQDREDMFVSLRGALGAATGDAPPTYFYRAGDKDRLAGLEPGEFSGRSLAHGELAYGIRLQRLVGGWFAKRSGNQDPDDQEEAAGAKVPGFLEGLRLVALVEVGSISASSDLGALRDPDDVVTSYGAALEKETPGMRGAAFRLGYGWSPESVRSGGRIFTTMSWAF
ncbi:MAG: hypothetical protein JNK85_15330 [Verrucomicrobiales bacterium]|nr:hypothetical protein [Verrucomicrobiales bacterium]